MSEEDKPGQIVDFNKAAGRVDERQDVRRKAKAANLQKRFSASRMNAETKLQTVQRLKKIFKNPKSDSPKKP